MNKGDIVPLEYSREARHRVVCGLNWDARERRAGLMEKLRGVGHNVETHDLDLACVMYGADGEFLDGVSGRPDENADQSGKVYHSGDDTTGTGDLDDEAISVELRDLPADIRHVIFVVEMQSKHTFADVDIPTVSIADGKTHKVQFEAIMEGPRTAFVFGRLVRQGEDWLFHYIGDYYDSADVVDWVDTLQQYTK